MISILLKKKLVSHWHHTFDTMSQCWCCCSREMHRSPPKYKFVFELRLNWPISCPLKWLVILLSPFYCYHYFWEHLKDEYWTTPWCDFFFFHPAKVVQSCGSVLEGSSVRPSVQLWIRLGSLLLETEPINLSRQHNTSVSQLGQGRIVRKWHETFLLYHKFQYNSLYMNWLQRQTYAQNHEFCIHCPSSVYLLEHLRNLTHYLLVFHFLVHWLINLFSKPFVVLWDLPFVWKLLYKYSLPRLTLMLIWSEFPSGHFLAEVEY